MNVLWRKVWADLWLSKSRSLLAMLSLAVGVFSVGLLLGMIDLLLSKMDLAHQQAQPSHISLILRGNADMALLARVKALPGVSGVDTMTPVSVRFRRPGEQEWQLATLIMRPDFSRQVFDQTRLEAGQWPSASGIACENLSCLSTVLQIGDNVEFETEQGTQVIPLTGIVRHPFVKPPKFGGQVHFFADIKHAELFGVPTHSFRQLLVQIQPPYSIEQARNMAGQIRSMFNAEKLNVNVTLLQDPIEHWGRPFLAGIHGVLKLMAWVSLALASVLIFNTVSAHVTQQTEQIGVMKALGASTLSVAGIYLGEVLLMGLAGLLLAMPLSLVAAHFSACQLLGLFNIDCGEFQVSWRAIAFMLAGGLLAPLLAALVPVMRGATMTVRVAIASYGLGYDFGGSRFDLWLERLGARMTTLNAAALCNLFRRKSRLVLTQSVLILAGTLFLVLTSLMASLNVTLDKEMALSHFSVRLGFSKDQPKVGIEEIANSIAATRGMDFWLRLPVELQKAGEPLRQKGSLGLQLLAVPANSSLYQPLIEEGRWLDAADAGEKRLLISADTARMNGIRVGDHLDVGLGADRQAWQVVGIYRWLTGSHYAIEAVYAPLETVGKLIHHEDYASFVLLDAVVSSLAEEADYLRQLKHAFEAHDITLDVYTTLAKLEQRQFTRNQFQPVLGTLLGLASMIAAVGGIGLSGTLSIGVLQRQREIGVLRAIGAPPNSIFRLFLLEGLFHGFLAWALSVPLAYWAAEPVASELGMTLFGIQLDYAFDAKAIIYWLLIVLIVAIAACYIPARNASRLSIRQCLGH